MYFPLQRNALNLSYLLQGIRASPVSSFLISKNHISSLPFFLKVLAQRGAAHEGRSEAEAFQARPHGSQSQQSLDHLLPSPLRPNRGLGLLLVGTALCQLEKESI